MTGGHARLVAGFGDVKRKCYRNRLLRNGSLRKVYMFIEMATKLGRRRRGAVVASVSNRRGKSRRDSMARHQTYKRCRPNNKHHHHDIFVMTFDIIVRDESATA